MGRTVRRSRRPELRPVLRRTPGNCTRAAPDAPCEDSTRGIDCPRAVQYHGTLASRAIPLRTLRTARGGSFSLEELRTRRGSAIFFAHSAACPACLDYAKQLMSEQAALEVAGAEPIVVIEDDPAGARTWLAELPNRTRFVCDPDGSWRHAVAAHLGASPEDVGVLVLDRFCAPRAGLFAPEVRGLIAPSEATEWSRFLALDGSGCAVEVPWPE